MLSKINTAIVRVGYGNLLFMFLLLSLSVGSSFIAARQAPQAPIVLESHDGEVIGGSVLCPGDVLIYNSPQATINEELVLSTINVAVWSVDREITVVTGIEPRTATSFGPTTTMLRNMTYLVPSLPPGTYYRVVVFDSQGVDSGEQFMTYYKIEFHIAEDCEQNN